jgi:hypothetical protein
MMTVIDLRTHRSRTLQTLPISRDRAATSKSLAGPELLHVASEMHHITRDLALQMKELLSLRQVSQVELSKECISAIGELSKSVAKLSNLLTVAETSAASAEKPPLSSDHRS